MRNGTHDGLCAACCVLVVGCVTPQYAVRQPPMPEESASALQIERTISAVQAQGFERQGARPIGEGESLAGFGVQRMVDRLSRVTERPTLRYRAYLYHDPDPNAAALADGRIYLSTGMLNDLSGRGGSADELAFVLGHELAHTVTQHLVKRYRVLQQQQFLMALIAVGASAITRDAGGSVQQAGDIALQVASVLQDVHNSGYSQEQELEADQLGIRYVIRAGYDPRGALSLLQDFTRFDSPTPLLRTHPYITLRRAYLERYLQETGALGPPSAQERTPEPEAPGRYLDELERRRQQLREVQRQYPVGSVSWQNLRQQIEALTAPTDARQRGAAR